MAFETDEDAVRAAKLAQTLSPSDPRRGQIVQMLREWDANKAKGPAPKQEPFVGPTQEQAAEPPKPPEPSFRDKYTLSGKDALKGGLGIADLGLSALSGAATTAVGGLYGMGKLAFGANPDEAADAVRWVQGFAYTPKTDAAKEFLTTAQPAFGLLEKADNLVKTASEKLGGGDPLLSTIAYTAINSIPYAVGGGGVQALKGLKASRIASKTLQDYARLGVELGGKDMASQLAAATEKAAGDVPYSRGQAMAGVAAKVREASEAATSAEDAAYKQARAGNAYMDLQNVRGLSKDVSDIISEYDIPGTEYDILKTDPRLKATVDRVNSWVRSQERAQNPAEWAGGRMNPAEDVPGTDIVPAGPRSGSADAIPMGQYAETPPQIGSNLPAAPGLPSPEGVNLPAVPGSRSLVEAGPRTTEETVQLGRSATEGPQPSNALVHLNEVDQLRRSIKRGLPAPGGNWTAADRAQLQIKTALDKFVDTQFEKDLIVGDPKVLQQWKDARNLTSEYYKNFESNKEIFKLATNLAANPEDFRKYVFGLSEMGKKTEAAQVIQRLKNIFGENSPELNAMRTEFLWDTLQPLRPVNGKYTLENLQAFVKNYDATVRKNKTLVDELSPYTTTGLDKMYDAALAAVKAGDPYQFTIDPATVVARLFVGHSIARHGAMVAATKGILNAIFGQTRGAIRSQIISDITKSDVTAPMFKGKDAELQGLWAAALDKNFNQDDNANAQ